MDDLDALLERQGGLAHRDQLTAAGVSRARRRRRRHAQRTVGRCIHVEVPDSRRPADVAFVRVHRTARPDLRPWLGGPLRVVSRPRAVVEAARRVPADRAAAIVIEAVQRDLVTLEELAHEVEAGQRRGSRVVRQAVEAAASAAWSVPELTLSQVLDDLPGAPELWLDPHLSTTSGTRLPTPDGWFDDIGLVLQVHSHLHHAIGPDRERTVMTDGVFAEHGRRVVRVRAANAGRRSPAVRAVPPGGREGIRL